eukprot:2847603-Prymnesium_polylepis.1
MSKPPERAHAYGHLDAEALRARLAALGVTLSTDDRLELVSTLRYLEDDEFDEFDNVVIDLDESVAEGETQSVVSATQLLASQPGDGRHHEAWVSEPRDQWGSPWRTLLNAATFADLPCGGGAVRHFRRWELIPIKNDDEAMPITRGRLQLAGRFT